MLKLDFIKDARAKMLLIKNSIQTPDGTILHSKYSHDYVEHKDANGKIYMVDGGCAYSRCSANGDEVNLSITDEYPHETIRKEMLWGSYGLEGDSELHYIKLKDMCVEHINSCLNTQTRMLPQFKKAMQDEIQYRESKAETQLWRELMDEM
tara:strand:- start:258 stop:710 length:453 start_codon:yes stop_codon:yes gene_type:complete